MGIIVDGKECVAPAGVYVKNFTDPSVFHFKNQARPSRLVNEVIVHETVTRSWSSTVDVLKQRGLGVHFIADVDGTIYQHADLMTEEMWHASQHNPMSVGIEVVNPFDPKIGGDKWSVLDNTPWTMTKTYTLPPLVQAEAVCQLLNWLTSADANPLTIPQKFPGLVQHNGKMTLTMGRVAACATPPNPGILAHYYFGHGDGAWLVLYAWLRLEALLDPVSAYAEAQKRAQGTTLVDLTDYFDNNPYLTV